MRVAIIGRSEILFESISMIRRNGHEISAILTAREAPEYKKKQKDYRDLAESLKIPYAEGPEIKLHHDFLLKTSSDIAVSLNYVGIIPQSIIDIFPLGILNVHGGDLPKYRGNACQAWAILNGEEKIGLCVHKMVGGELDTGDIIAKAYYSIDLDTSITKVWKWMSEKTPNLIIEALTNLQKNKSYILEKQNDDSSLNLRCYPRAPEDGRVNWEKSSVDIIRLINASNKPYAGAYCIFKGYKMIIWEAKIVDDQENFSAIPGQVTSIKNKIVNVACGKGKISILKIEFKKEITEPSKHIKSLRSRLK